MSMPGISTSWSNGQHFRKELAGFPKGYLDLPGYLWAEMCVCMCLQPGRVAI